MNKLFTNWSDANNIILPQYLSCPDSNPVSILAPKVAWTLDRTIKSYALVLENTYIDANGQNKRILAILPYIDPTITELILNDTVTSSYIYGLNSYKKNGYSSPCPLPGTGLNTYTFSLYGLTTKLCNKTCVADYLSFKNYLTPVVCSATDSSCLYKYNEFQTKHEFEFGLTLNKYIKWKLDVDYYSTAPGILPKANITPADLDILNANLKTAQGQLIQSQNTLSQLQSDYTKFQTQCTSSANDLISKNAMCEQDKAQVMSMNQDFKNNISKNTDQLNNYMANMQDSIRALTTAQKLIYSMRESIPDVKPNSMYSSQPNYKSSSYYDPKYIDMEITQNQCQQLCDMTTDCGGYSYDNNGMCSFGMRGQPLFEVPNSGTFYTKIPTASMLGPGSRPIPMVGPTPMGGPTPVTSTMPQQQSNMNTAPLPQQPTGSLSASMQQRTLNMFNFIPSDRPLTEEDLPSLSKLLSPRSTAGQLLQQVIDKRAEITRFGQGLSSTPSEQDYNTSRLLQQTLVNLEMNFIDTVMAEVYNSVPSSMFDASQRSKVEAIGVLYNQIKQRSIDLSIAPENIGFTQKPSAVQMPQNAYQNVFSNIPADHPITSDDLSMVVVWFPNITDATTPLLQKMYDTRNQVVAFKQSIQNPSDQDRTQVVTYEAQIADLKSQVLNLILTEISKIPPSAFNELQKRRVREISDSYQLVTGNLKDMFTYLQNQKVVQTNTQTKSVSPVSQPSDISMSAYTTPNSEIESFISHYSRM
uniref:Uncharacterized protein n=1 Tax=viral metagenome TaxID=1070528 RepID=A0A6C0CT40_9ZZZZ